MAITYTWKITNLKKMDEIEGNSNVVVHARWQRTGTDENGNTGDFQGATPLRLPESGSSFAPYEELTEEQVVQWVKDEIAAHQGYEEHIVGQIMKQINAKKAPVIDVDMLPWGVQVVGSSPASVSGSAAGATSNAPRYVDTAGLGS